MTSQGILEKELQTPWENSNRNHRQEPTVDFIVPRQEIESYGTLQQPLNHKPQTLKPYINPKPQSLSPSSTLNLPQEKQKVELHSSPKPKGLNSGRGAQLVSPFSCLHLTEILLFWGYRTGSGFQKP